MRIDKVHGHRDRFIVARMAHANASLQLAHLIAEAERDEGIAALGSTVEEMSGRRSWSAILYRPSREIAGLRAIEADVRSVIACLSDALAELILVGRSSSTTTSRSSGSAMRMA